VSRLQDQLREAYREAAATVRPESIARLDLESGRAARQTARPVRRRSRGALLLPVAAAVSVAAVAVGATAVVHSLAGQAPARVPAAHHPHRHSSASAATLAALPQYTVLNNGDNLEAVVTATGHVAGHLRAPAGHLFAVIAGTGADRTFFAATDLNPQTSCKTSFYKFTLSAAGQPSGLTRLPVSTLPGLPTALAASADGHLAAYSVTNCAGDASSQIGSGQVTGGIGLINLAAGQIARTWTYTLGEDYTTDLSMSADGSLLGYSNFISSSSRAGRVLTTSAASGSDQSASRVVVRNPVTTALSASGQLMYAITGAHSQLLAAYATASGQQVKVLHRWSAAEQIGPVVTDPAGGYALIPITATPGRPALSPLVKGHPCTVVVARGKPMCEQMTRSRTSFVSINLASGRVTTLPFTETGPAFWGMAAW
jgi:hypothetical protein